MTPVRWLIVIVYLIPIIGTLVAMVRRLRSLWSFGREIRERIPDNPVSRTLKKWSQMIRDWWGRRKTPERLRGVYGINAQLGRIEYLIGHLRDYTIGVVMTAGAVFNLTMCLLVKPENVGWYFYDAFYFGLFALLSLFTYRRHVTTGLKMTEFMRVNPWVHPQEFFNHYYKHLGPLNEPIPEKAVVEVNPEDVSYRTNKEARIGYGRLLYGFYDTAIFARSAYKALDTIGPAYGADIFDVMAQLWGSRMIQLFRSRLKVVGTEKFQQIEGKVILVFNHKSHLDFVLNFFGLSKARLKDGRPIRPRYMAAKDHFVDNKLVYNGLGVGRLIESVDMVFVDRMGRGVDAIAQAANVLAAKDISIAMYPQGTRAYGNLGSNRERRDAGFYTAGSSKQLKQELGHLKKGCAFLALDTAIQLHRQEKDIPVNLVFIGIEGTADLVPKASVKVRTECEVTFKVGDTITIYPRDVGDFTKPGLDGVTNASEKRYQARIEELMYMINDGLVKALDFNRKLIDRFVRDVRSRHLVPADNWLVVKNHLIASDQRKDLLPFQIIDRIYALDPSYWDEYLQRAAAISAMANPPQDQLRQLNEDVVDFLLKTRGKLMKRAAMIERVREKKLKKAS